jgi:predicted extracellular nuclease
MKIKQSIVYFFLLFVTTFLSINCTSEKDLHIYVATWNLENLFDTIDDPEKNDEEFMPEGKKEWTELRLDRKLDSLAKVIQFMNDGKGPDLLGVQEVEHERLLTRMLGKFEIDKEYNIVYEESLDKRGIDNGLIYNSKLFKVLSHNKHVIELESGYPTRYILEAELVCMDRDTIIVYVNHWPSRGGGQEKSEPNRIKAAEVMKAVIDSALMENKNANIIVLGDFNDEPLDNSLINVLKAENNFNHFDSIYSNKKLYNLSYPLFEKGEGTYLYKGDWNMLDQIIVSGNLLLESGLCYEGNSFEIIKPEFTVTKEGKYRGASIPTFGGRNYLGGFSDHFSVGIKLLIIE